MMIGYRSIGLLCAAMSAARASLTLNSSGGRR
jgi:hypothetical protein